MSGASTAVRGREGEGGGCAGNQNNDWLTGICLGLHVTHWWIQIQFRGEKFWAGHNGACQGSLQVSCQTEIQDINIAVMHLKLKPRRAQWARGVVKLLCENQKEKEALLSVTFSVVFFFLIWIEDFAMGVALKAWALRLSWPLNSGWTQLRLAKKITKGELSHVS